MDIGVKPEVPEVPPKGLKRKEVDPNQRTKLTSYFRPTGSKQ